MLTDWFLPSNHTSVEFNKLEIYLLGHCITNISWHQSTLLCISSLMGLNCLVFSNSQLSNIIFILLITDAELGLCMEDLCKFITGSASVPPLGLPNNISVTFKHGCLPGCKCRPTASTCALTLVLPCHANSMVEMEELFTSALRDCHGFGRV